MALCSRESEDAKLTWEEVYPLLGEWRSTNTGESVFITHHLSKGPDS